MMPNQPVASLSQLPPLGRRLWLTLVSLVFGVLNLAFFAELWPHTPGAKPWLLGLEWLLLLTLPPQFMGWARRWLRAYAGPGWVWLLAAVGFVAVAFLGLAAWALLLALPIVVWLWK
jgi:hypothetical protein